MLEIYPLSEENISEVAKVSGRHEADLKCMLAEGQEKNQQVNIMVDRPDNIPEGFGRTN